MSLETLSIKIKVHSTIEQCFSFCNGLFNQFLLLLDCFNLRCKFLLKGERGNKNIEILKGETSREKTLLIRVCDKDKVEMIALELNKK